MPRPSERPTGAGCVDRVPVCRESLERSALDFAAWSPPDRGCVGRRGGHERAGRFCFVAAANGACHTVTLAIVYVRGVTMYSRLLSPVRIGNLELRNRVAMSPMGSGDRRRRRPRARAGRPLLRRAGARRRRPADHREHRRVLSARRQHGPRNRRLRRRLPPGAPLADRGGPRARREDRDPARAPREGGASRHTRGPRAADAVAPEEVRAAERARSTSRRKRSRRC